MKLADIKRGYLGIVLPTEVRSQLLARFPATFEKVLAHHVTVEFLPGKWPEGDVQWWLNRDHAVEVVGVARDDGLETVVVHVNGRAQRADGHRYHITLSLKPGRKPSESKALLDVDTNIEPVEPFKLATLPASIIPY